MSRYVANLPDGSRVEVETDDRYAVAVDKDGRWSVWSTHPDRREAAEERADMPTAVTIPLQPA